ncbi:glucosidase II beta subunit-like protein-domain-containing protein [Plectosphaerella plurivora]|uniref:Endoplasmic reticulum lectin n=1 Tax=Plectosphaerella plurivora TaxID=936078 RepID=A0A9P9A993_9PEZI|nr:glucosidase II beta subunit-like protein-domain-containing protein [Plectosphaerella plurivora]
MRRLNLALFASAQLAAAARQQSFSPHDDLVAYPQYEIVFSEGFISQREANSLVDRANPHGTYSADFASQSSLSSNVREASTGEEPGTDEPQQTYEVMHIHPSKYLCSVPVLEPAAPYNETASELAKQEEARELARASAAGWELLSELEGTCLYFMSGWWSYSFCYNRQIVQFHALPMMPNGKPPVRDPKTMEFVLGRAAKANTKQKKQKKQQQTDADATPGKPAVTTDLQVKGDQRYLMQRLDGGTICDLTNRERTIEVQYHCVPGMKGDRIAWIKEVTTCAYLMVVNTPRLCNDVAFLPPSQTTANPITCRLILDTDDPHAEAEWHRRKTLEAEVMMGAKKVETLLDAAKDPLFLEGERPNLNSDAFYKHAAINVGGVVVGGRNVLGQTDKDGKAGTVLKPPMSYLPNRAAAGKPAENVDGEETVTIATKAAADDGGEYWTLNAEELDELDIDTKLMNQMVDEMERHAQDQGWSLELAEGPDGQRELRGYLDKDDVPENQEEGKAKKAQGAAAEGDAEQEQVGSQEDFYENA